MKAIHQPDGFVVKDIASGAGSHGFDSRPGQIGTVLPTACHRCDVSSKMCCPDVKPRRWSPPLVTRFVITRRVLVNEDLILKSNPVANKIFNFIHKVR